MLSAVEHPEVVSSYVVEETAAKCFVYVGVPETAWSMGIHASSLRVVPKKNQP